jgi:hypothetical protein
MIKEIDRICPEEGQAGAPGNNINTQNMNRLLASE